MADTPEMIRSLVERFKQNIDAYKSPNYNETEVRVEFVNPFWKALGWDVDNKAGYALQYRDVVHEDAIKFGGSTKAPDYCFRIGGTRKFFLETKRPSINIKDDPTPAYQLRRYAWSCKLPLSILTDFEEMAVYDCRIRPGKNDKSSKARIMYFHYAEYVDKWDEIASIFSREAVLKGSFDRYAEATKGKHGTMEVDASFLKEIELWRDILAKHIALKNPQLSVRDLNFAVQITIDRIIFLRMCEDRSIETYGRLLALCAGPRIYQRLLEIYTEADQRYNSGLFHFQEETGRQGTPDKLTPNLKIDDKILKEILERLYYPESPYEFSILPTEILGNVYEQFLGKVIRLTTGHQAKVEEKPEVRKAGGVYYTPQYIVNRIVNNTVGRFRDSKSPEGIRDIRILDPACGSGSFLLSAYDYLLTRHLEWYLDEKNKTGKIPTDPPAAGERKKMSAPPVIFQGKGGDWFLTTKEKKRILLNNIFGVDIDAQAVEVTKLSLLLKVLENENQETLKQQLALWRERALPDLSDNIKCGNSLIGPDFYHNGQLNLFDDEEIYRINAFDWHDEKLGFGKIMKTGGFDCMIGNPPYIRIQAMKEWAPVEVEYLKSKYKSAGKGNYDIYVVFIEKGLELLKKAGRLGFIVPHKFFNSQYGEPIRDLVSSGGHLEEIVHFGHQQVFAGPTTYTCLLFLNKEKTAECRLSRVIDMEQWRETGEALQGIVKAESVHAAEWNFVIGDESELFEKLGSMKTRLGDICDIFVGLQTSADDVFIMDFVKETKHTITLKSRAAGTNWTFEKELLFPILSGTDVNGYNPLPERQYVLFPYLVKNEKAELIEFEKLQKKYPRTAEYLLANKKRLEKRENGKFKDRQWYRLGRSQNLGIQNRIKLCVPRLVSELHAGYDADGSHKLDNVDVGGVTLKPDYANLGLPYLHGLLNSKLLKWYFKHIGTTFRGGWMSANSQFISKLPVRAIDFSKQTDVDMRERIIRLARSMIELHEKLPEVGTPNERERIQRRIAAVDNQINALVYELYELTEKEIEIINI